MQFRIVPSPSDDVILTPYRESEFPTFRAIFERVADDSPLRHLARDPEEAATAVVLENRSGKDITALRYRWVFVAADGESRTKTISSDSYLVDVYRPVASAAGRQLLTQSGIVDEAFLQHALAGGGFIAAGSRTNLSTEAIEIWLQIDLILFADGEIAGSDPDHFLAELQCRKPAAEYVAKHIRSAISEGRDPAPVLTALCDIPHLGNDHLAHLVTKYARRYLHTTSGMNSADRSDGALRHLENRPVLPEFYRADSAGGRKPLPAQ